MNRSRVEQHTKIQAHHLERAAYVYVRQSSPYPAALEALREYLPKAAPNAWQRVGRETARMQDLGLPGAMAKEVGLTNQWPKVFLIAELHERTKCPIPDVARVYLALEQAPASMPSSCVSAGSLPPMSGKPWRCAVCAHPFCASSRVYGKSADGARGPEVGPDALPTFSSAAEEVFQNLSNRDAPIGVPTLIVFTDRLRKALTRAKIEPVIE